MEESYFLEKSQQQNLIIATGGGIIISQKNRYILKNAPYVFYLKAYPKFLISRLAGSQDRPLFNNNDQLKKLEYIYKSRKIFYNECASHIINIEKLSKIEKINKIIECLN